MSEYNNVGIWSTDQKILRFIASQAVCYKFPPGRPAFVRLVYWNLMEISFPSSVYNNCIPGCYIAMIVHTCHVQNCVAITLLEFGWEETRNFHHPWIVMKKNHQYIGSLTVLTQLIGNVPGWARLFHSLQGFARGWQFHRSHQCTMHCRLQECTGPVGIPCLYLDLRWQTMYRTSLTVPRVRTVVCEAVYVSGWRLSEPIITDILHYNMYG